MFGRLVQLTMFAANRRWANRRWAWERAQPRDGARTDDGLTGLLRSTAACWTSPPICRRLPRLRRCLVHKVYSVSSGAVLGPQSQRLCTCL